MSLNNKKRRRKKTLNNINRNSSLTFIQTQLFLLEALMIILRKRQSDLKNILEFDIAMLI